MKKITEFMSRKRDSTGFGPRDGQGLSIRSDPSNLGQRSSQAGGSRSTHRARGIVGLLGSGDSDVEEILRDDGLGLRGRPKDDASPSQPSNALSRRLQKVALDNKPASEFDNFYTPNNKMFYDLKPYMNLDSKRHEIRLLRVIPKKTTYKDHHDANKHWERHRIFNNYSIPLIATELMDKVPLSSVDGRYCVLSYCAGTPKTSQPVLVDGMLFNAFANLGHALDIVLNYWVSCNRQKELLLWVDQICINQDDKTERASQVAMMRDIYRRSNEVLVCLSTYKSPDTSFSWIPKLGQHDGGCQFATLDHMKEDIRRQLGEAFRPTHSEVDEMRVDNLYSQVEKFVRKPWWKRAWVFQEFIAAPRATFLSGRYWISWTKFRPILHFLCHEMIAYIQAQRNGYERAGQHHLAAQCSTLIHDLSLLDMSAISSMAEGKANFRRPGDLKDVLRHARYCQATDLRDRVYAFVSMAHKGYSITPNYNADNNVIHVLVDAAVKIIKYENNLSILGHVSDGRGSLGAYLPSWVPDWTSNDGEAAAQLRKYIQSQRQKNNENHPFQVFPALEGLSIAEFRREKSNETTLDMKVCGVMIANLDELEAESIVGLSELRSFATDDGVRAVTLKFSLVDDEIWALHGAPLPVILRPEGDGTYSFISEALLTDPINGRFLDVMFGSLFRRTDAPRPRVKEIWLV